MSLCVAFQSYNDLIVAVDSAVSTKINGEAYRVSDDFAEKIRIDKYRNIYFCSGNLSVIKDFNGRFIDLKDKNDIYFSTDLIKEYLTENQKKLNENDNEDIRNSELGVLAFKGNGDVYSFATQTKFEPTKFEKKKGNKRVYCFGFKSEKANELVNEMMGECEKKRKSPIEMILTIYNKLQCEEIGGTIALYYLKYNSKKQMKQYFKLPEPKDIKKVNSQNNAEHGLFQGIVQAADFQDEDGNSILNENKQFKGECLDLKGINVIDDFGNTTFSINQNGAVTINGGSISFNSIDGLEDALSDIENEIPSLPSYLKSTYIDGTSVNAPVIRGGVIAGAVFTDLDENTQLILNPQDSHSTVSDLLLTNSSGAEVFKIHDGIGEATLSMYDVPVLRVNTQNDRGVLLNCDVIATFG